MDYESGPDYSVSTEYENIRKNRSMREKPNRAVALSAAVNLAAKYESVHQERLARWGFSKS